MESPFAANEHPKVTNVRSKAANEHSKVENEHPKATNGRSKVENEHSKAYLGCLMIWEHFIVYRFS